MSFQNDLFSECVVKMYLFILDLIDLAWLVSSILSVRQMLDHGWTWSFAWIFFNSFPWVKREMSHLYKDSFDESDITAITAMIPGLKSYLPFSNR